MTVVGYERPLDKGPLLGLGKTGIHNGSLVNPDRLRGGRGPLQRWGLTKAVLPSVGSGRPPHGAGTSSDGLPGRPLQTKCSLSAEAEDLPDPPGR